MLSNNWIRQAHRWLSVAFTAAVIVNILAMIRQEQAVWVGLLALLPLVLLVLSGLYLFALPYGARWRSKPRRGEGSALTPPPAGRSRSPSASPPPA